MNFTTKLIPYQPQIDYHQQILNIKEKFTFLGVTSDNKPILNKHIQIIGKKIVRSVGIIYKLKNFVCTIVSYTLTNSIAILFGQIRTKYILNLCLHILQKRVIRKICIKPFLVHKNVLFKECKILKLSEINTLCVSVYMHKNRNKFELIGTHDYQTRNRGNLRNTRDTAECIPYCS